MFFLVGMPAAGKSFLAEKLKEKYDTLSIIDLDKWIEQAEGESIKLIFEQKGEAYFREIEAQNLRNLPFKDNLLVSTGGGTPCFHQNMDFMLKKGKVIFLDTPLALIESRIRQASEKRPLFIQNNENLSQKIKDLYQKRIVFYQKAHYHIKDIQDIFSLNIFEGL